MKTHQEIDRRGLALACAIVERIDADPEHRGLDRARKVCARWMKNSGTPAMAEWQALLQRPWSEVRAVFLMDSEEGNRLRQNSPFCGILSPRERWDLFKKARRCATASA